MEYLVFVEYLEAVLHLVVDGSFIAKCSEELVSIDQVLVWRFRIVLLDEVCNKLNYHFFLNPLKGLLIIKVN